MQPAECVVGVENGVGILAPQVVFHIFARERGTTADHRELKFLTLEVLDHVFHFQRGLDQQPTQPDRIRAMFLRRFNDHVTRLLDSEINHAISIVRKNNVHEVLADVVDVAFHRSDHDRALLPGSGLLLHLGFEVRNSLLHHAGSIEHRGQLHFARPEQVADCLHSVQQHGIN